MWAPVTRRHVVGKPIKPKGLGKRPLVGLFSPSEPLGPERQLRLADNLKQMSGTWTALHAPNAFNKVDYMAGTVAERIADMNFLLDHPDVDVLLSTWGGKSATQLIPELPYEKLANRRLPILGFSDVAAILNAITLKTGLITFYGPNVAGKLDESRHASLDELQLDRPWPASALGESADEVAVGLKSGTGEGLLLGGNLSTFASLYPVIAFERWRLPKHIILFWEAGSGTPQAIDQTLTMFRQLGLLERVKGMIVGVIGKAGTGSVKADSELARGILNPMGSYSFPVLSCATFGHDKLDNPLLPIGCPAQLSVSGSDFEFRLAMDPIAR